jgi:hypothetical protein
MTYHTGGKRLTISFKPQAPEATIMPDKNVSASAWGLQYLRLTLGQ